MSDRVPVERLSYGCLDIIPVERDWDSERLIDGEWSYWEAFDYEPGPDGWTLIAQNDTVVAAFTDGGERIDLRELDDFLSEHECEKCAGIGYIDEEDNPADGADCPECNGTGNDLKVNADQIRRLEEAEPSMWGAQGPMMNYSYGMGGATDDHIGGYGNSSDAIGAAYRLRDLPLCIVEIEDKVELALTGGGMDLSWEIVEAYTALGLLPPVHFDLPGMAGRGGDDERDRYLIAAVDRSLVSMVERMQRQLQLHREKFGG